MEQIMLSGLTEMEYRIKTAIDRLQAFEPEEGYYLCFSGGKDSQCIYHLALESGVKFDAHYNITGIDPPELVQFIKAEYPDVKREMYEKSMWRLIEKNGLPTRLHRFCCRELKEHGGEGRICVTGVRKAESFNRSQRKPFEIMTSQKKDRVLFNDNDYDRMMFENCQVKGKRIVNPIIDWTDNNVWYYIKSRKLKYCKLYDEGFTRLGCIGCPMAGKGRIEEFKRYPKIESAYKRAFARYLKGYLLRKQKKGESSKYDNFNDWWNWWLYEDKSIKVYEGQESIIS